jgi:hypothetical protein
LCQYGRTSQSQWRCHRCLGPGLAGHSQKA